MEKGPISYLPDILDNSFLTNLFEFTRRRIQQTSKHNTAKSQKVTKDFYPLNLLLQSTNDKKF